MLTPTSKAWLATTVFSFAGVISLMFSTPSVFLVPHVLFYAVLIANTFFSVRLFSSIQPNVFSQFAMDTVLAFIYVALALSIGSAAPFVFLALCLFVVSLAKYALMLGVTANDGLLKRKILVNLSGTALCTGVLVATLFGYELESAWSLALLFMLANVYLLIVKPMYRLHS